MLKNMLLVLTSVLLTVLAAEFVLKLVIPERQFNAPRLITNRLTYVPDQKQQSSYLEWDYSISINADGFRNEKTVGELGPGSILAIGDSFTEGYGVAFEHAYGTRLEARLRKAGRAVSVYNAGHYDTGPLYYKLVYDKIFKNVDAIETVVMGFFITNDFLKTAGPYDGRLSAGNEYGDGWEYRIKTFLASHSIIYSTINYVLKSNRAVYQICRKMGLCARIWRPAEIYTGEFIDKAVPLTVDYLVKLSKQVRADGRRFVVMLIPPREHVDDRRWTGVVEQLGEGVTKQRFVATRKLRDALTKNSVEVLDLTDLARAHYRSGGVDLYYTHDGHWNPAGHDFAAKQLFEVLGAP